MTEIIFIHDLVEENGKTIRENNLEKQHRIPIGSLVKVNYEDFEANGIRLYVKKHTRDCDGTPLYTIGIPNDEHCNSYGLSEDSLTVIKKPSR